MEEEFIKLAHELHNDRYRENRMHQEEYKANGEDILLMFRLWCYGRGKDEEITDGKAFAKYLDIKKIKLTGIQRKYLLKKFGYKAVQKK